MIYLNLRHCWQGWNCEIVEPANNLFFLKDTRISARNLDSIQTFLKNNPALTCPRAVA